MDTETLLRRNVAELRSLLDLSYARECRLIEAVKALQFLLEGAAIAPARVDEQANIVAKVAETLRSLTDRPVPNHGLFVDYARQTAELKAAAVLNGTLNSALNAAQQQVATLTADANNLRLRVMESEVVRDAIVALLNRRDLTDSIEASVKALVQARSAAGRTG
jgi:hypothetical protein